MNTLQNYEKACEELRKDFVDSIFPNEKNEDYGDWIGDVVGEVLLVGDMFVNIENMAGYFRYKFTPKEFFNWYFKYTAENSDRVNMMHFKMRQKNK